MTAMIPFRPFADILTVGTPRVDIKDAEDHLEIVAEVPGMKAEDVEVTVQNGVLSIVAKDDQQKSEDRDGYVWRERRQQSLQRAFRLPRGTTAEQIRANLEHGLLTVSVEKTPAAAPTRIAVESGAPETPAAS